MNPRPSGRSVSRILRLIDDVRPPDSRGEDGDTLPGPSSLYDFYNRVLGLHVIEEWNEEDGRGCIFGPHPSDPEGSIEIYEMDKDADRYQPAFSVPVVSDKIDIQLRTSDLDPWVAALNGIVSFTGPETTQWGHRWIKLRDPDHLLIAIYEVLGATTSPEIEKQHRSLP